MYPFHLLYIYRPFYSHKQSLTLFCFLNLHKWHHAIYTIMLPGIPTNNYIVGKLSMLASLDL